LVNTGQLSDESTKEAKELMVDITREKLNDWPKEKELKPTLDSERLKMINV